MRILADLVGLLLVAEGVLYLAAWGLGRPLTRSALALALLLPLVLLAPFFIGQRVLAPTGVIARSLGLDAAEDPHSLLNDSVYQFLPWERAIRRGLAQGDWALWSEELEGGSSAWVNPQAGVLSPIAAATRWLPFEHYLSVALALKMVVGFLGAWVLARRLGLRHSTALLVGMGFVLGGGMMAWALFPHTRAVAWAPWVVAAAITLARRLTVVAVVTSACLIGALLLSGHPEVTLSTVLLTTGCAWLLRRRRIPPMHWLGALALSAALGFGLALPHLLPFLDALPESQRVADLRLEAIPRDLPGLSPASWFRGDRWAFLNAAASPYAYGRPFHEPFRGPYNWAEAEAGYAGLLALAGVAMGLLLPLGWRYWSFLLFAALSLLLTSQFLPLAHLAWRLPVLDVTAFARFLPVGSLALVMASAVALDGLRRRRGKNLWREAGGLFLALLWSLCLAHRLEVVVPWLLILAGLAWLRLARRRRSLRLGTFLLAAGLLADLGPWAWNFLPQGDRGAFYPNTPLLETAAVEWAQPGGPWRTLGSDYQVYPSLLTIYGGEEVRTHNPMAPKRYLDVLETAFGFAPGRGGNYFSALPRPRHALLDFLGVRTVIQSTVRPPPSGLERLLETQSMRLLRNPAALPRWFFPAAIDSVDEGAFLSWLADLEQADRVAVRPEDLARHPTLEARADSTGEARLIAGGASSVRLRLDPVTSDRLLATSILEPRQWQARGSHGRLSVLPINGVFVGVVVPGGEEEVRLSYRPPHFILGLVGAAISASLLLVLVVLGFRWRRL